MSSDKKQPASDEESTDVYSKNSSFPESVTPSNQPGKSRLPKGVIIGIVVVLGLITASVIWSEPKQETKSEKPDKNPQESVVSQRQLPDMIAYSNEKMHRVLVQINFINF